MESKLLKIVSVTGSILALLSTIDGMTMLTAFEIMISSPPRPSIASTTILSQSTNFPTSWLESHSHLIYCYLGAGAHALNEHSLDIEVLFDLCGGCLCPIMAFIIIDGNVATLGGEFLGQERSESPR